MGVKKSGDNIIIKSSKIYRWILKGPQRVLDFLYQLGEVPFYEFLLEGNRGNLIIRWI